MKIRFINSNEPVTTFYRDLVPRLSDEGHEVEILTSRAEYRLNRDLDGAVGGLPGVTIVKTTSALVKEYNKTPLSKAIVRSLYALHGFGLLLSRPSPDLNVFLTQPPFFYAVGPLLRKLRGQQYSCVVMDVQPQQFVEFGLIKRKSVLDRVLRRVALFGYSRASQVIVIGRCMAERLIEMGVDKDAITLIPNWTNEKEFLPIPRENNALRRDMGWGDDFVISYGGNIGFAQDFDVFIAAAERLKGEPGIRFVLVGGGSKAQHYKDVVAEKQLDNFEFLPFLHEEYSLAEIYGAGDANFISLRPSCTGLGVPSKAYNTLAAGRPIVYFGSADSEIAQMVAEESIGSVVSSADELASSVRSYVAENGRAKAEGQRARFLADGKYSRDSALDRYLSSFQEALR